MFGLEDERLIENLEKMRQARCSYGSDLEGPGSRCDCKFGATGQGEQTGCPELRQAITLLRGEFEKIIVTRRFFEASAANTLRGIRQQLDQFDKAAVQS